MNTQHRIHRQLSIEELETRAAPAVFLVTSAADAGAGSLRQAILDSNAAAGADEITFDAGLAGGTILLTSGELAITDDLAITGLGYAPVTIDGNANSRIFTADDGSGANLIQVEITSMTLTNGLALQAGGAVFSREGLTVRDSTVSGSHAADGGGITSLGALTIVNSTISGNEAANGGGGIASIDGPLTIENSTISGNEAAAGGGIFAVNATLTLRSTIVAGNTAPNGPDLFSFLGTVAAENSLIGDNADSGLAAGNPDGNGNRIGTAASPIDPLLGPLAENGGPTRTHALLPGSPAVDNGANPLFLQTDQRGYFRTVGAATDIGAYESGSGPVEWVSPNGNVTVTVFDVEGPFDIDPSAISVFFGPNDTVTAITLGGSLPGEGLGFTIHGASSVGLIQDVRTGPRGDLGFFASDSPIGTILVWSNIAGHNLNDTELGGIEFDADIDGDYHDCDPTAIYADGGAGVLALYGGVTGDIVLANGGALMVYSAGELAGDVLVDGPLSVLFAYNPGGDAVSGDVSVYGPVNSFVSYGNVTGSVMVDGDLHVAAIYGDLVGFGGSQGGFAGQFEGFQEQFVGPGGYGFEIDGDVFSFFVSGLLDGPLFIGGAASHIFTLEGTTYNGSINVFDDLFYFVSSGDVMGDIFVEGDATFVYVLGEFSGALLVADGDLGTFVASNLGGTAVNGGIVDVFDGNIGSVTIVGDAQDALFLADGRIGTTVVVGDLTNSIMQASQLNLVYVTGTISRAGSLGFFDLHALDLASSFTVIDATQTAVIDALNPVWFSDVLAHVGNLTV